LGTGEAGGANPSTLVYSQSAFFPGGMRTGFLPYFPHSVELPTPSLGTGQPRFAWRGGAVWGDSGGNPPRTVRLSLGLYQDFGYAGYYRLTSAVQDDSGNVLADSWSDWPEGIDVPLIRQLNSGRSNNSRIFQNFME